MLYMILKSRFTSLKWELVSVPVTHSIPGSLKTVTRLKSVISAPDKPPVFMISEYYLCIIAFKKIRSLLGRCSIRQGAVWGAARKVGQDEGRV